MLNLNDVIGRSLQLDDKGELMIGYREVLGVPYLGIHLGSQWRVSCVRLCSLEKG